LNCADPDLTLARVDIKANAERDGEAVGRPHWTAGETWVGSGLEAELAVRWLAAALTTLFDGLLALELEDRNDVALVDVPARQTTRVNAVSVRFDEHHA